MKSALHKTKNDLSEKTRRAMIELLNQELANVIDLSLQTKQAHWNVKGPHFIALHELFDDINEAVTSYVDEIAERAVQLGGIARGTVGAVAAGNRTHRAPSPTVWRMWRRWRRCYRLSGAGCGRRSTRRRRRGMRTRRICLRKSPGASTSGCGLWKRTCRRSGKGTFDANFTNWREPKTECGLSLCQAALGSSSLITYPLIS